MQLSLTAVFQKVPEGYVAFVEELPGANTQGETLEETREPDGGRHACVGGESALAEEELVGG